MNALYSASKLVFDFLWSPTHKNARNWTPSRVCGCAGVRVCGCAGVRVQSGNAEDLP